MRNIPAKIGKALIVFSIYLIIAYNPTLVMLFSFALLLYIGWEYHHSPARMSVLMILVGVVAFPTLFQSFVGMERNIQPGLWHFINSGFWLIPGILLTYNKKIIRKIKS